MGRAPDGVLRLPAHDARLLSRRLQATARVQLGGRRGAAAADGVPVLTGYLLPWDQIAFWAITIGTNMATFAPLFNTPSQLLLLGGIEVGQNTLLRFYVLHVILMPLVAALFLAVHFWRIRKDGGISGPL
jgi:hypothetical protein